jgi:3-methylcrotonyl-CoA carboxylase alpha subunit
MFQCLLIANRGEIACRIIRTCQRLGIKTVAVYSDADANALHVKNADQAVHIGGSRPGDSYLLGDRIIAAAKLCGAQAIHPGFGFLSENADFADAVEQAGLIFVGPRSASMRKMGSKAGAKTLMQAANVPVVPGYEGAEQDLATLRQHAEKIGFPLMIKAAHGGGGKGMRIVHALADFDAALESCQREAKNAFGRDRVLLERYIKTPRHIEIQIFGDQSGQVLHLNERECSVQRRYQKIIEESPSPLLTPELRAQMGAAAVKAGLAIDYLGAGTVEFIMGPDRQFYFMEINTRLQVEHPVTEACLDLDLVEWQLRVASGQPLPWQQSELIGKGHAIEVRIYAEDPENQFLPASGTLERLRFPEQGAARIDSGVAEGDLVSVFYDPMIAKLIVHAPDRAQATAKLTHALQASCIGGIKSNIDFLEVLIRHPDFIDAKIDTGYLDRKLADIYAPALELPAEVLAAASVFELQQLEYQSQHRASLSVDPFNPWAQSDGFRIAHQGKRALAFEYRGARIEVSAHGFAVRYQLDFNLHGTVHQLLITDAQLAENGERLSLKINQHARIFDVRELQAVRKQDSGQLEIHDGTRRYTLARKAAFEPAIQTEIASDRIKAPMPGRIVAVKVALDQEITLGQELLVMEAMKMELSLKAPMAGKIAELRVNVGDFVEADAVLLRLS